MLNDIYQSLDPVAFSIGNLSVRWYGLAYLFAFLCGGFIIAHFIKRWRVDINLDDIMTLVLCAAFGVIIGARLGYCIVYGAGYYLEHPLAIFQLSQGGMSFHGGFIGAIVGAAIAAKITGVPFLTLADLGAVAAPVGLFFGRCANFVNGELWGKPTDLPWGVVFSDTGGGLVARHPSQLYEALLEGVVLFIVLFILARKNDPPHPRGTIFATFIMLYGVFRTTIEFVRLPDEQIGYLFGTSWVTMGMCLSVPLIVAGLIMLIVFRRWNLPQMGSVKRARLAEGEPEPSPEGSQGDVPAGTCSGDAAEAGEGDASQAVMVPDAPTAEEAASRCSAGRDEPAGSEPASQEGNGRTGGQPR